MRRTMKRQPGISRLILLVSLAATGPRAAPGVGTNAVEMASAPRAVIRCNGYEIRLPRPKAVPVRMHEPFQEKPEAAREDVEEPEGGMRRWGGEQRSPSGAVGMPAPPAPPVRAAPGDPGDRRLLSASVPDSGAPDPEPNATDTRPQGRGWLAEDVFFLEKAARREDRVRREAEANRAWADALSIDGGADLYVPGKSLFDRKGEGDRNTPYVRPDSRFLGSGQPEPERPARPFVWSPPGK